MTGKTKIEWTDKTWNPIVGCSLVSPGRTNCYAMKFAGNRLDGNPKAAHYAGTTMKTKAGPVWTGKVAMAPDHILTAPLRWRKPAMTFVNSMGDLFHEDVPDAWIDRVFAIMALTPQHTYQVLTKRADRMKAYMSSEGRSGQIARAVLDLLIERQITKNYLTDANYDEVWPVCADHPEDASEVWLRSWPLSNVWMGVSVEDQARADERIPHLLEAPAAVRFISAEPLLGPIDLTELAFPKHWGKCECTEHPTTLNALDASVYCTCCCEGPESMDCGRLDWVIVGGESGKDARPMHPDWARSLRDQCADAGVPFFFKQWGEWLPMGQTMADGNISCLDKGERPGLWHPETLSARIGKKAAGNYLDGVQHRAFPEAIA